MLWWLKLKKFFRGRIEDLRFGTKIRENLCTFCLLRKDFISKFDPVPTLNYYCYLYCFGLGKLYDWGQLQVPEKKYQIETWQNNRNIHHSIIDKEKTVCAPGWARTTNLLINSQTRCQLRHGSVVMVARNVVIYLALV
ncbi:hypothetical protein PHYBLDRAFT_68433 [Phycomyces blakesleeanus NRRL 1555(-)]|uniref:Uncharacterized protein n=1 Tax=Phycomyces blakesleeanus (strain ATCC 8743b / DSM 1359 / FGSC 10004 / NBRC 33097 / NRRL 1555) TaxID=763407 RepID=A0A167PJC1_PHYB8|nr:hypothetical protein PHYBLDRAFT_68433 [Phycomyces blakesleeanus NRRL 1555(-)]OAD78064.1 hypothetical protein PHYBLDRAFT_68433 [Phycomyces blakesleeanus NRRL 1555(-)]|eukprot:XP_018296104.1 hypothetical protein PHYBLDRAFT_68433 [Phycomyces blakesleeanus NRRL 1555(-)]